MTGAGEGHRRTYEPLTMPRDATAEASVKSLYRHMQRCETQLGGGEGMEGVYGSITRVGMEAVVMALQKRCDMTQESALVDVGAGLGRPLMHAMVSPGLRKLWGIEVDAIKVQKAEAFVHQVMQKLKVEGVVEETVTSPKITHSAIENVESLGEYTHVYSFWEGVPMEGKRALGRLFTAAEGMTGLAVVQRAFRKAPEGEMAKLGFHGLELQQSLKVRMSGSGQVFHAYIFRKKPAATRRATVAACSTPLKHRPRPCHDDLALSGEMSVVRRSLLSLELDYRSPCRSKSDAGCTRPRERGSCDGTAL